MMKEGNLLQERKGVNLLRKRTALYFFGGQWVQLDDACWKK